MATQAAVDGPSSRSVIDAAKALGLKIFDGTSSDQWAAWGYRVVAGTKHSSYSAAYESVIKSCEGAASNPAEAITKATEALYLCEMSAAEAHQSSRLAANRVVASIVRRVFSSYLLHGDWRNALAALRAGDLAISGIHSQSASDVILSWLWVGVSEESSHATWPCGTCVPTRDCASWAGTPQA